MSNNAKKSISATIGTLILMLIINHYFKPNTFDFIIGYMVTNLFIRLILLEQWFQVTLERKQEMSEPKLEFEVRAPGSDMRTTVKVDGYNYQAIDRICKQTNITLFEVTNRLIEYALRHVEITDKDDKLR